MWNNNAKLAVKVGNHATNRVNTIYYGKNGITDGKTTYTYDGMGNIISVNENGKQRYKYTYDKIGRLISEKDLYNNKEVCYTYDNSGNIRSKNIDGQVTEYRYKEGTDRLVSFGKEAISYDGMGNPVVYRGMSCTWEKGRLLASIKDGTNTVKYTYDVFGLRNGKKITSGSVTEETSYVYENGRLLRQISGNEVMDFIYGSEGVDNIKRTLIYFCKNEHRSFNKSLYFESIKKIVEELGFRIISFCDRGKCGNNIYLGFSIVDQNGQTIWIEDDGFLSYSTNIMSIDSKNRVKFFLWEEDGDFIDSIKWVVNNLNSISEKSN